MSHEITIRTAGKAEMAYVGNKPWHGLGEELQPGTSIEEWQAAAGMDWKIQRAIVRYAIAHGSTPDSYMSMNDKHVLLRSDTKAGLGIVSDNFKIVQPSAVLEFFRDLTMAAGFTLETAGTLFGGKRFWALAAIGETASIADPADKMKGYLLLSTACDGSMATEARYTTVRVVCNNTLSSARSAGAKVRVTHRTAFKADCVKKELGVDVAHERFATTMQDMRRLANTRLTGTDAMLQTAELFSPGASKLAKEELLKILDSKPVQRVGELAIDSRAIGNDMDGVKGTQWGWLNSVTQYVDHEARARSTENRLNSAWFGRGADLKERAYEMCLSAASGTPATNITTFRQEQGATNSGLLDDVLAATTGK
jgi:phage/plasmid-like protein (TIGR03299 family)